MVGDPFFAEEHPDYLLISNEVLPAHLDAGVRQAQIDQLMVENPRRFLGVSGRGAASPREVAESQIVS